MTTRPVQLGIIDKRVIDLLGLLIAPNTPIFLGQTNKEHMKQEHPDAYEKYFHELCNILSSPTYVAKHPNKDSIEFIKEMDDHVLVAVRVSKSGVAYARTLFIMNDEKVRRYKENPDILKEY